jgi:hypothetical protein
MKQKIVVFNCIPDIYLFEEGCGYKPHPPYKSYDSLKEAIKENPTSKIHRYPSKNIEHEF